MSDLLNHLEYTKLFLIISIGMIALTYLIHILSRKKPIVKFIPGIIALIVGVFGLVTIDPRIIFLDDITNLSIFVLGTATGLVGICIGLIINIFNKKDIEAIKKSEKT